jgi:hypothetical protein
VALPICVPSISEVAKVKSYFSGLYQCYGLNVQATCDAQCQFTSLSVLCPDGGTSDRKAFCASHVCNIVQELLGGFFILSDNACVLTSTLLIQYSGKEKQNSSKDAFIFFSQLWIQIEQAFGLLVTKWCVFKKLLEMKFRHTTLVIEAAFHLHNFCIAE